MITTGVIGHEWRAAITPWGAIEPWPGSGEPLDWWVAADDRWHVPAEETSVRQTRLQGTAVVETRVRVPRGDVVQQVYTVADAGGVTVVEVTNESPLPVAIAFGRRDVLTERPIVDVPIEGIELSPAAFALPLGHQASLRIGIPHGRGRNATLPGGLPPAAQVARGWLAVTDRASRFALPDGEHGSTLAASVTAQRCEIALGTMSTADEDPAEFAVALGELVRMGERPDPWLPELVDAVEHLGRQSGWEADAGLAAAGRVLAAAGESRAERDLERIVAPRPPGTRPSQPPQGALAIPWLERGLVSNGALLPSGLPADWLGQSVEAYGVPTGPVSTVSFAIRWHGSRPALLWEQTGDPVELCAPALAPAWHTLEPKGETLWPEPGPVPH